jgi:hypothetical protein
MHTTIARAHCTYIYCTPASVWIVCRAEHEVAALRAYLETLQSTAQLVVAASMAPAAVASGMEEIVCVIACTAS